MHTHKHTTNTNKNLKKKLARTCSLDGFKAQVTECAVTPDAQKREENLEHEKVTPHTVLGSLTSSELYI